MIRVTIQYPEDGGVDEVVTQIRDLAKTLTPGEHDDVVHQFGFAPAGTYGLTIHFLPEPAAP